MDKKNANNINIAIIHESLLTMAGSEKTLAQIADCFPNADLWCLYTSFSVDEQVKHFGRTFKTT